MWKGNQIENLHDDGKHLRSLGQHARKRTVKKFVEFLYFSN